jgi:hypothetical protein
MRKRNWDVLDMRNSGVFPKNFSFWKTNLSPREPSRYRAEEVIGFVSAIIGFSTRWMNHPNS